MDYVNLGRTGLKVSRICLGCMTYGEPARGNHPWTLGRPRAGPSSSGRSTSASPSSTRRTSTRMDRAKRSSAVRSQTTRAATGSCSPPRSTGRCTPTRTAGAYRASTSWRDRREPEAPRHRLRRPLPDPPLRPDDADRGDPRGAARRRGRPARPAISAPRRCMRGSSAGRSISPTGMAGPGSSRCRTTTTSSIGRRSARWSSSA